ncbi:MAG TPA: hypothetical protein VEU74_13190 [Gemmatimonadales bacterium]|nr:hypothetical protein [Gemmatimonadales bacterium]
MKRPRTLRRQLVLLVTAGLAIGAAVPPLRQRPTGPVNVDSTQADTPSLEEIRARAARVVFDTVLGAADAQPLLITNGRRTGWAKIEPARDVYRLDSNELARGRVVARISAESAYAPLGLGRGLNWWWIDRRGGKWRSVIYSEARRGKTVLNVFDHLIVHAGYDWEQGIARFVFFDVRAAMWINTLKGCVPGGLFPDWYWSLERAAPWGAESKVH